MCITFNGNRVLCISSSPTETPQKTSRILIELSIRCASHALRYYIAFSVSCNWLQISALIYIYILYCIYTYCTERPTSLSLSLSTQVHFNGKCIMMRLCLAPKHPTQWKRRSSHTIEWTFPPTQRQSSVIMTCI